MQMYIHVAFLVRVDNVHHNYIGLPDVYSDTK
jgi:hypothetical protein